MKKRIADQDLDLLTVESRWRPSPGPVPLAAQPPVPSEPALSDHSDTFRLDDDSVHMPDVPVQDPPRESPRPAPKRNHAPQIIDEDTEHFKIRLEHLLTVFKTDAVTEFLTMKRSMLQDQKEHIKQDTAKYLTLYEEKHAEATSLKEALAQQQSQNVHLSRALENISLRMFKAKEKDRRVKLLQLSMRTLAEYRLQRHKRKVRGKLSDAFFMRTGGRRLFGAWSAVIKQRRAKLKEEERTAADKRQFTEACLRYQKEISDLKHKLEEAGVYIRDAEATKMSMQEQLKKAFMRGVSALNFEAMNVLQGHSVSLFDPPKSGLKQNTPSLNTSEVASHALPSSLMKTDSMMRPREAAPVPVSTGGRKQVLVFQSPAQSKEHRWKDAQVVGESMSLVRGGLFRGDSQLPQITQTSQDEGKVIKVSKGKSFVAKK